MHFKLAINSYFKIRLLVKQTIPNLLHGDFWGRWTRISWHNWSQRYSTLMKSFLLNWPANPPETFYFHFKVIVIRSLNKIILTLETFFVRMLLILIPDPPIVVVEPKLNVLNNALLCDLLKYLFLLLLLNFINYFLSDIPTFIYIVQDLTFLSVRLRQNKATYLVNVVILRKMQERICDITRQIWIWVLSKILYRFKRLYYLSCYAYYSTLAGRWAWQCIMTVTGGTRKKHLIFSVTIQL